MTDAERIARLQTAIVKARVLRQIIRGGLAGGSGAFGAPFDFTIQDAAMVEKMRQLMETGQEIKLHYYSYEPTLCSSDSGHFVTSVEPVR